MSPGERLGRASAGWYGTTLIKLLRSPALVGRIKYGDKEVTLKITDKTTFKRGDKDVPADKALPAFAKMKEGKSKFEVTTDKDTATEIKFPGKKK